MRVAALDRPRMFEQFWKMGLAKNFNEWQDAVRMQQLPLFNTAYADRDGHIEYLYNAAVPVRPKGDYKFWSGVVPGDQSALIWDYSKIVTYDQYGDVINGLRLVAARENCTLFEVESLWSAPEVDVDSD